MEPNQEEATPCNWIQVEVCGKAFANDCGADIEPLPTMWLTSGQLEQLYTWIDKFQAFEMSWGEDTLPMRLIFSGQGTQGASEADQVEICAWVNGLLQSAKSSTSLDPAGVAFSGCELSPPQVPLVVPWTPTPDRLCLERRKPESGQMARIEIPFWGTPPGA